MPRSRAASASSATAQRARRRSSTSCRPERPRRARRWPRWCRSGSRTSASPSRRRSSGSTFRAIRSPASEASSNRSGSRRRPSSRPRGTPRACFSSGTRPGSRRRPPRAATAWRFSRSRTWTGRSRSRSSPSPTRRPPRASPRARRSWCGAGWTTARRDGSCSPTTSALSRRRSPRTAAATASAPASPTRARFTWRSPPSAGSGRPRRRPSASLSAWQRTQLARPPKRPHTRDFVRLLFEDFVELHGDRLYGDDAAIVGGLARFEGQGIVVIGHQKGRDTREKIARNFGMPHPEGYRKALRLMQLAEKFGKPVLSLIDTPGAYPGVGAEERGQAEAIARNLREMAALRTPVIAVVTGEGGSGGALAIGMGNRVLMLEYAIYSVISPEGCAAILWGDAAKAPEAAAAMGVGLRPAAGACDDVAVGAERERLESAALGREDPVHQGPQLGAVDDAAPRIEGLVVDLAHDAELAQPLDAHPVGLRERAEARGLLGDHADPDERNVHRLCGLVDRPDLGVAEEPAPLPLDLAERQEVLHGQRVRAHVGPVLGRHHPDQRVRGEVHHLERALTRERVEGEVAEPSLPQLADRLVKGEPAREPYADPVGRDLLEVGGRGVAELLLHICAPARRHDHRLAQAERFGERRLQLLGARQVELDPDEALVVGALEEPPDRRRRDAERPGDLFLRPRPAVG